MRSTHVVRASKKVALFRPILEFLMAKQPAAAAEWAKEAALLHKHSVHTPDCWAHLSPAQRESIVAKGLPAEVAKLLNDFVTTDGAEAVRHKKILVAFGSHTGTAESYAKMLGTFATGHGFVPIVCSLNDAVSVLRENEASQQIEAMLVVASTCGTGEFTSNSKGFWKELESGALSKSVKGLKFSVMGLGNSTNDNFNAVAKKIDKQLRECGATSFQRMTLSCELQPNGHDAAFRTWKRAVWSTLGTGTAAAAGGAIPCSYDVVPVTKKDTDVHRPHYYRAHVASNSRVSADKFVPESHQLVFSVPLRTQEEELGRRARITDQVSIHPRNTHEAAERAAKLLGVNLGDYVEVNPQPGAPHSFFDGHKMTIEQVLREIVDLSVAPSRTMLETVAEACADEAQRAKLEELANDLSANSAYDKLIAEGFTTLDLLERFPAVKVNLAQLLSLAPHIAPRTYSLARDNTNWLAEEFEVVYNVPTKARHTGLCTTMMANLTAGDDFVMQFVPDVTTLPKNASNVVIIALGSGIGSARALLQHRQQAKEKGEAVGKAVLYFGFRNTGKDQLFKAELDAMSAAGLVDVRYVPSRDGADGKFVTPMDVLDRSVTDFLGTKGEVVYCGLGGSVPLKVESALQRVGVDVAALRGTGRYHEEYFTADQDVENLLKDAGANTEGTLLGRMGNCDMFCFQCEQTFKNRGCHKVGVCGKTPRVAALQDLTVHGAKMMGFYASRLRALGAAENAAINHLTLYAMFTTLTNVNFDESRFVTIVGDVHRAINALHKDYVALCAAKGVKPDEIHAATFPDVLPGVDGLVDLGRQVGVLRRFSDPASQSAAGVTEMLVYGLKGLAAYTDHALMNNKEDTSIYEFMHRALSFMLEENNLDLGKGLELALECGKANVTAMSLLYNSNKTLGVPEPTVVPVKPRAGKCILVSGHDLIILKGLLEATEPLGIDVYTHGEMLPAHSYPELKKHKNLAGHFGGAWMRQSIEFPHFPGAILMTTNCLTEPQESYGPRLFTAAAVGWKDVPHIGNTMKDIDFKTLIASAQEAPGFGSEAAFSYPDPVGQKRPASLTVGFGHETVLSVAPAVLDAIKSGDITRFFVVGGCDGFEGQRSYYTDLVSQLPPTAVVLTVGCGKFRLNHLDLGTIGKTGIPRILDMGQCNDSFSAVQVALTLADVLKCQVSDLPLSIVLSWFEQKAIAVLLSCLHLGLKPIHVGPSLPAFLTPEVLDVLVKNFGIRPLGDPAEDLKVMLAAKGAS